MRLLIILSMSFFFAAEANAKCFAFRDLDLKVCVDGDAARKAAVEVCEDVSKKDCKISGSSGECRPSGDKKCYDKDGKEQKHLKAD